MSAGGDNNLNTILIFATILIGLILLVALSFKLSGSGKGNTQNDLGKKLLESAKYGKIGNLLEILNKDASIVNYANWVVLIFFQLS